MSLAFSSQQPAGRSTLNGEATKADVTAACKLMALCKGQPTIGVGEHEHRKAVKCGQKRAATMRKCAVLRFATQARSLDHLEELAVSLGPVSLSVLSLHRRGWLYAVKITETGRKALSNCPTS